MSQPIAFSSCFNVHQFKEVSGESNAVVFKGAIPRTMYGFLERVGTSYWSPDTYMLWLVDSIRVEKVQRLIGNIDNPIVLNPPILVKREVKWIAFNETDNDIVFEVLCDGICYPKGYKFKR